MDARRKRALSKANLAGPRPAPGNKLVTPFKESPALPALLLLALALRVIASLATGIHHPDAVYQYLEPANRLLTGEGVVTWEWRVGMRGWLLPWLFTAPVAAARAVGPGLELLAARLCVALASLGVVWAAWRIGGRVSVYAAVLAGFVAATWFELVYFAAQTLSESLATAALLPAAALLTDARATRRALAGAGLLLGFAVLARPHYAPAVLTMVAVRCWTARGPERTGLPIPLVLGALAALLIGAVADLAAGASPLAWLGENVRQNLLLGKAARFGASPADTYLLWWWGIWRWAAVPIALGAWWARRACPPLLAAALVNLAVHCGIAHKEYRFVLFSGAVLVILAAIGWAEAARRARWPQAATLTIAAALSLALALTGVGPVMMRHGHEGPALFARIARDPAACGVAIADEDWGRVPGHVGLGRARPLLLFSPEDPAFRKAGPDTITSSVASFNDLVAPVGRRAPPGFARVACDSAPGAPALCLWSRPGGCDHRPSRFEMNAALARFGG